jgi:hypothetical protein
MAMMTMGRVDEKCVVRMILVVLFVSRGVVRGSVQAESRSVYGKCNGEVCR